MSRKVFFGNYKGGVGKTTTVYEIGALLAEKHNKKVLLVDLDPQCSLSKICAKTVNKSLKDINVVENLNYVIELYSEYIQNSTRVNFLEGTISSDFSNIKNCFKNIPKYSKHNGKLDFIPTVLDLKNCRLNDISARLSKNTLNVMIFAQLLNDIDFELDYDYIFFDCPPTSNLIIQSVFLACDYYLIPTVSDEISSDGVADYITEIESTYLRFAYDDSIGGLILKKYFGEKPQLLGVLLTLFKGRAGDPSPADLNVSEALDKSISAIGTVSRIKGTEYAANGRKNIFKTYIKNLDNRSNPNNYGIPITLSNGDIHQAYAEIANVISNLL